MSEPDKSSLRRKIERMDAAERQELRKAVERIEANRKATRQTPFSWLGVIVAFGVVFWTLATRPENGPFFIIGGGLAFVVIHLIGHIVFPAEPRP